VVGDGAGSEAGAKRGWGTRVMSDPKKAKRRNEMNGDPRKWLDEVGPDR